MAYPPTVPPATRTDSTPQFTNHPNDHNAISTALTDLVNELGADPSGGYATVNARLDALDQRLINTVPVFPSIHLGPGQSVDTNSTTYADWLLTTVSVPAGFGYVAFVCTISGLYEISGTPQQGFNVTTRIGGAQGSLIAQQGAGINKRFTVTYTDVMALPSTSGGSYQIGIAAQRPEGGTVRFDEASLCVWNLRWAP